MIQTRSFLDMTYRMYPKHHGHIHIRYHFARTTIENQTLRYLWETDMKMAFRCKWPQHYSIHPTLVVAYQTPQLI